MENHIKLLNYKINKIEYKFNEQIKPGTQFQIKPKIECKMGRKDKNLFVNISIRINEDISSPVPFDLEVALFGQFVIDIDSDQKTLLAEAIDTLYPYLRAAVAGITVNCNIPAYIMPAINAQAVSDNMEPGNVN